MTENELEGRRVRSVCDERQGVILGLASTGHVVVEFDDSEQLEQRRITRTDVVFDDEDDEEEASSEAAQTPPESPRRKRKGAGK